MSQKTHPVQTQSGKVTGRYEEDGRIAVFKGIPYARPPVGQLRWKPPQPAVPWDGVRPAESFGPAPIQLESEFELFLNALVEGQGWGWFKENLVKLLLKVAPQPEQSEDCLYLNIRTPAPDPEAHLPVMVWIHGGDHQDGSAADILYDSNALALRDVVLVSINYRLGLMGYFAHPQLSEEGDGAEAGVSGNYGTLDQIAALRWVQQNVRAFGGDPGDVTIFGESAGGESVAHMMTSPLSRGLFHKAIMQSPANGGQMRHLHRPFLGYRAGEDVGRTFADHFVPPGDDQIDRLRQIPPDDLYSLARKREFHVFYPLIDGHVLEKSPFETFLDGDQAQIPLLLGSNADEGTLLYPLVRAPLPGLGIQEIPPEESAAVVREAFGEDAEALLAHYPGLKEEDPEAAESAAAALLGDSLIGAPVHFYAQHAARAGQPTFLYTFTRTPPSPNQTAGAYHAAELTFVHDTGLPFFDKTAGDEALTRVIGDYWTQFAKSGDPNADPHPHWPAFNPDDQHWMRLEPGEKLGPEPVSRTGHRTGRRTGRYAILQRRLLRQIEQMKRMHGRAPIAG